MIPHEHAKPQTTNLGAGSSNLSGRANNIKDLSEISQPLKSTGVTPV